MSCSDQSRALANEYAPVRLLKDNLPIPETLAILRRLGTWEFDHGENQQAAIFET